MIPLISNVLNISNLGKSSKKNCDETVRLTDSGGGHPPPCLTDSICEKFRTIEYDSLIPKTDFTSL